LKRRKTESLGSGLSNENPGTGATLEQSLGEAIRRLRDIKRLSVRALASKCGFSPSFISQVELNQASPSLASLERIAAAIGVTIGEFFLTAEQSGPRVVRSSRRPMLQSGWSRSQIESLGNTALGSRLEALLVTMRGGGISGSKLHANETELFALVLAGSVMLHLADANQVLRRGDAVVIPVGTPYRWENKGVKQVQLLLVRPR